MLAGEAGGGCKMEVWRPGTGRMIDSMRGKAAVRRGGVRWKLEREGYDLSLARGVPS